MQSQLAKAKTKLAELEQKKRKLEEKRCDASRKYAVAIASIDEYDATGVVQRGALHEILVEIDRETERIDRKIRQTRKEVKDERRLFDRRVEDLEDAEDFVKRYAPCLPKLRQANALLLQIKNYFPADKRHDYETARGVFALLQKRLESDTAHLEQLRRHVERVRSEENENG